MELKTLPQVSSHPELFFKYKHHNENLGAATVHKGTLLFDTVHTIPRDIKHFFEGGLRNAPDWEYLRTNYSNTGKVFQHYKRHIENYCKMVWLATDYINEGGLRHPVGIFYDPKTSAWRIHPGGSRQKILHLLHQDLVDTIAFNTTGKDIEFDLIFNNWYDVNEHYKNLEMHLVVVADSGSLIPHIHFSSGSTILDNVQKSYNQIVKFYKSTKLQGNFSLSEYGYINPKKYKNVINITLDNPLDVDQQAIAFVLAPMFQRYHGYGVHIEPAT